MEKIKRQCVRCKKGFLANRYYGLRESMGNVLACPNCREGYIRGNPSKQVKISEAEYVRGRRDRERLRKIKKVIKPVHQILKNIE